MPLTPAQRDDSGQRFLRIAAWVLIAAGVSGGVGSILFTLLQSFARAWLWTVPAVVLVFAFREEPFKRLSRFVGLLMVGIWLHYGEVGHPVWIGPGLAERVNDSCLGFMLTILGTLILLTNDLQGRLRVLLKRWSLFAGARRKTVIALGAASLWVLYPQNTHSLCLTASKVCEHRGAYGCAITFARLARDTFPDVMGGGNPPDSYRELSARIVALTFRERNEARLPTTHGPQSSASLPNRLELWARPRLLIH